MPLDKSVLGFSNRWYPEGIERAEKRALPDGQEVAIFTLPYFLASKIEAFLDRGKGDFYGSEDIEDIISVLDGCEGGFEKLADASKTVKTYIKKEFLTLLRNDLFVQCVQGHLGPQAGPGRVQRVLALMKDFM